MQKNDVYNLNRRIEILAQRIAILESEIEKRSSQVFVNGGILEVVIIMTLGAVVMMVIFYQSGVFY